MRSEAVGICMLLWRYEGTSLPTRETAPALMPTGITLTAPSSASFFSHCDQRLHPFTDALAPLTAAPPIHTGTRNTSTPLSISSAVQPGCLLCSPRFICLSLVRFHYFLSEFFHNFWIVTEVLLGRLTALADFLAFVGKPSARFFDNFFGGC